MSKWGYGRSRTESGVGTYRTGTRTARTETETAGAGPDSVFVVAMIENRAREVGMAVYNFRGLDFELRQFADSMAYTTALTHLLVYDPVEIVLSQSGANGSLHGALQRSPILTETKESLTLTPKMISFIARRFFNETSGLLVCQRLSTALDPRLAATEIPKYLALASLAALKSYVEQERNVVFAQHCLRIQLRIPEDSLFLDLNLIAALEILRNNRTTTQGDPSLGKECLLGVLNHTKTRSGRLFLRRALLEPPRNIATIGARQEFIAEVLENEELYFQLSDILNQTPDVEAVLGQLVRRQNRGQLEISREGPSMSLMRQLLLLRKGVETVPTLVETASKAQNPILSAISQALVDPALTELMKAFDVIDPEAVPVQQCESMRLQAAFAVRAGVSNLLDVSRKLLSESIEDMQTLTEKAKSESGIQKMVLAFNTRRGYHFSVAVADGESLQNLEDNPLQVVRQRQRLRFTTATLLRLNERYSESLSECHILSNEAVQALLETVWRQDIIVALGKYVDSVAELALLDCLLSFVTHVTLSENYVRPRITEMGPIAIKVGRHPVMETILERFVPHDTFLSDGTSFQVVSGVNMSGKSTYLKTLAALSILAHTGSWVPAEFASFRLLQQISTRMGTGDSLDDNRSSFSQEMSEVASIIHQVDSRVSPRGHLVLIDELGRSTATADGFAIAWATAEKLAVSRGVLAVFVTHYTQMSILPSLYPNIKACHMGAGPYDESADVKDIPDGVTHLRMTYQLVEGSCALPWYGISTAAQAGFPTEILSIATAIRAELSDSTLRPLKIVASPAESGSRRVCHEVHRRLLLLREAELDQERLLPLLLELQAKVRGEER